MGNYGQSLQLVLDTYIGGATKLLTSDMRKRVSGVLTQIENIVTGAETQTAKVTTCSVSDPGSQLENCKRSQQMLSIAVRSLSQTLDQLKGERVSAIKSKALVEQQALFTLEKKQENLDEQLLSNVTQIAKAVDQALESAGQTLESALQVAKTTPSNTGRNPASGQSGKTEKPSAPDLKIAVPKLSKITQFDTIKTEKLLDDLAVVLLGKGA